MSWKLVGILIVFVSLFLFLFAQKQLALKLSKKITTLSLLQDPSNIKPQDVYTPVLPSIDQIFGNDHAWVATLSAQQIRTLIATGDVIPARSVNYQAWQRQDFRWPYLKTAAVTRNADITFINLETPFTDQCPLTSEGLIFCGNIRNVEGLVYAGTSVVNLANNHAANYGAAGLNSTIKLLNEKGILITGISGVSKDVGGVKFAFLGYNDIEKLQPGISNVDEEKIKNDITDAKRQADVVIVAFHWGVEYQDQPDQRQKYLGHLAIDIGADLVIGNHPHWIQPLEIYKNKLITYAHGNFVFDQMWSQRTREGVIGKYTFFGHQLIDAQYIPIQINDFGQPDILDQDKGRLILDRMRDESMRLSNNL